MLLTLPSGIGFEKPKVEGIKNLPLEGGDIYPNAAGVLLRVFIEFSIERYIKENKIALETSGKDKAGNLKNKDRLIDKIQLVMTNIESNSKSTKKELDPIRKEMSTQFSILSTRL